MIYSIICNQVLWCDFGVKKDLVDVTAMINSHTHMAVWCITDFIAVEIPTQKK